MTDPDASVAWRLFCFTWLPLGFMAVLLAAGMAASGFSIGPAGILVTLAFGAVYGGLAWYNAHSPHRRDPKIVFALGATAQVVLVTMVMTPMTYIAAAANLPMQDATLLAIDRAFGLDWLGYVTFVNEHPTLASWLTYGYSMIRWPIFGIPVLMAWAGLYLRLQQFTLAFLVALILTTVISGLVPAIGVFQQLGLDPASFENLNAGAYLHQLRDLPAARDGSLRALDLLSLGGIVTFPSFHAASALLYTWALWPMRWVRPFVVLANVAMLLSTPINGGHYFIDLAAGIAVAVLAIVAARRAGAWIENRAPQPRLVPAE